MCAESVASKGPLFGPDYLLVEVDDNNKKFALQIYPDVFNTELKAKGMATHYFFIPQSVYIAKKQTSEDFDFGVTIFKGLMTEDTHFGIRGQLEIGGGFCSFATTFAVPGTVIFHTVSKCIKSLTPLSDSWIRL